MTDIPITEHNFCFFVFRIFGYPVPKCCQKPSFSPTKANFVVMVSIHVRYLTEKKKN